MLTQILGTLKYIISRHTRKAALQEVDLTNLFDDVNACPQSNILGVHFPCNKAYFTFCPGTLAKHFTLDIHTLSSFFSCSYLVYSYKSSDSMYSLLS